MYFKFSCQCVLYLGSHVYFVTGLRPNSSKYFQSCFFSHFSPIIVILLTNIGMFSYAAYILHSLQRNVRKGKSNKSYQSQTSSSGNTRECLHRQYSRQLSGKVTSAVSDNLKKQKANIERWVIYELHMHSV